MNNIKIIFLSLIISFFIGYILLKDYINIKDKDITYGFIYGVFDKDDFDKETLNLSNYIYKIDNDKYIVYIGLTRNENNIQKLKTYFENKGYDINIQNISIDDKFKEIIDSCDVLLEKVDNDIQIEKIENKILEYGVI